MKKPISLVFIALTFICPSLVAGQDVTGDSIMLANGKKVSIIQYGVASFYHNKFEGRQTATGEIFSQKNITAASNRFPLNSWVKVTNTRNKRSIILRINDRMHPKNQRLIDLSRSAASKLNYTVRGLTRVKVEYLGNKKPVEDSLANGDK